MRAAYLALLASPLLACATGTTLTARRGGAAEALACVGRTLQYRDVERSWTGVHELRVGLACLADRVVVRVRWPAGGERCTVRGPEAMAVWRAAGQRRARAELRAAQQRARDRAASAAALRAPTSAPAGADEDRGGPDAAWPFHGGSCSCRWPGDPTGRHCWDHPCDPPRERGLAPVPPTPPERADASPVECEVAVF